MSDFAKLKANFIYSKNSDYSLATVDTDFGFLELTPDEYVYREITVGTTAYTYDLGNFTAITALCLVNLDVTNFVEAEWHYKRGTQGASATLGFDFAAADTPETILDNDANGTFVTNGAEDGGYVWIANAEDANNDGAFLISQAVDGDNLTIAPATALGTDNTADTTATLTFTRKNKERCVASNGPLLITGPVYPTGDLVLQADTAACNVALVIFGT